MPLDPLALFVAIPILGLTALFVYFVRQSSIEADIGAELDMAKGRRNGYWASSVILAGVYILTGMPKVSGLGDVMHRFQEWGYSENFMMFIGATEFVAGIFLLIPRTSLYAAGYLSIIMTGAIYTHLAFDTWIWALLPAGCLAFLAFIAYEDWDRRDSW
jgi:uncharacterized membrane protein YphA (DoxX/SURF4 family)